MANSLVSQTIKGEPLRSLGANKQDAYRAFRKHILENCQLRESNRNNWRSDYEGEKPKIRESLRQQMIAFRGYVRDDMPTLLKEDPSLFDAERFQKWCTERVTEIPVLLNQSREYRLP